MLSLLSFDKHKGWCGPHVHADPCTHASLSSHSSSHAAIHELTCTALESWVYALHIAATIFINRLSGAFLRALKYSSVCKGACGRGVVCFVAVCGILEAFISSVCMHNYNWVLQHSCGTNCAHIHEVGLELWWIKWVHGNTPICLETPLLFVMWQLPPTAPKSHQNLQTHFWATLAHSVWVGGAINVWVHKAWHANQQNQSQILRGPILQQPGTFSQIWVCSCVGHAQKRGGTDFQHLKQRRYVTNGHESLHSGPS